MLKIEEVVLDNGLKIYLYQDQRKYNVYVNFVTKFGGLNHDYRFHNKNYNIPDGMAHLLEHFICEYSAEGNIVSDFGLKHMDANATTSMYKTEFYFMSINNIEYGLEKLIKAINSPVFTEENLTKVKAPIYQELKMHEDRTFYNFNHEVYNSLFKEIPFRDIGGFKEEVNKITLEDLKRCYEAFYTPTNQYLFIGGNFKKNKVLKTIKKAYKNINFKKNNVKVIYSKEKNEVKKKRSNIVGNVTKDYVEIAYKVNLNKFKKEELLKLDFYLNIFLKIKLGIISPLYNKLVKEKVITTGIDSSLSLIDNYGILSIGNYSDHPNKLVKEINKELTNKKVAEEDFNLFKKELIARIAIRPEKLSSVIDPFVDNIVVFDYPYLDSIEYVKKFNYQEFNKLINKLDFSNYSIVTMKKKL